MSAETIEWISARLALPDEEETALVKVRDADPAVWLAYRDGDIWRYVEGFPIEGEVTSWARMPEGPVFT